MSVQSALEQLRAAEIEGVRAFIPPGGRVLELGGGSGYQALIMSSWGCRVVSVDVPGRPIPAAVHYPMLVYDGARLPFSDSTFDVVFSSNVLEHVAHREALLCELRRVSRPEGRAIHIVPSASWRIWTSGARLANFVITRRSSSKVRSVSGFAEARRSASLPELALGPPHGEYRTVLDEYWQYRRQSWKKLFISAGYRIIKLGTNHLFYTGYTLLPLSVARRRMLSRVLGSSCHVFVLACDKRSIG